MTDTISLPAEVAEERVTIPVLTPAEVADRAGAALDYARRFVAEVEAIPLDAATSENVFDAWDRAAIVLEDAFGPISILNSVHPDKAVRDAGDDALVAESSFMTELFQNEQFYERVRRIEPRSMAQKQLQKD